MGRLGDYRWSPKNLACLPKLKKYFFVFKNKEIFFGTNCRDRSWYYMKFSLIRLNNKWIPSENITLWERELFVRQDLVRYTEWVSGTLLTGHVHAPLRHGLTMVCCVRPKNKASPSLPVTSWVFQLPELYMTKVTRFHYCHQPSGFYI